jgi:hypothetical protein
MANEQSYNFIQKAKDSIGDRLDYGSCPLTNDTLWRANKVVVQYSTHSGIYVSTKGLKTVPAERAAQIIFERGKLLGCPNSTPGCIDEPLSIDKIAEQCINPDKCHIDYGKAIIPPGEYTILYLSYKK